MASTRKGKERHQMSAEAALAGVLALVVDAREHFLANDKSATKTELLLSQAGLTVEDIAAVTGKNHDAIRKTIQRGRGK